MKEHNDYSSLYRTEELKKGLEIRRQKKETGTSQKETSTEVCKNTEKTNGCWNVDHISLYKSWDNSHRIFILISRENGEHLFGLPLQSSFAQKRKKNDNDKKYVVD
jgi:hypothetical protein